MAYITRVTVGKASDPGKTRDHNEDFYLASESGVDDRDKVARQGRLFIVADGMGGHASGEEASKAAVEAIHRAYEDSFATNPTPDVREALTTALLQANAEIFRKARVEGKQGMGTTAVCAVVLGDELFVAHVGDSRAYLVHDEKISQLTTDHSWVAQQQAEKKDDQRGGAYQHRAQCHPTRVRAESRGRAGSIWAARTGRGRCSAALHGWCVGRGGR